MANYTAALANDGIVWKPRMVLEFRTRDGATTKKFDPVRLGVANTTPSDLSLIRDGMRAVVSDPNGTVYFKFLGFSTAAPGKSGTAETPSGNPDSWSIGFAPHEGRRRAAARALWRAVERVHERGRHLLLRDRPARALRRRARARGRPDAQRAHLERGGRGGAHGDRERARGLRERPVVPPRRVP